MVRTRLSDDQRRRIERALEDQEGRSPLHYLEASIEFHYFVWHFNWDDDVKAITDIVSSRECDHGTGLLAYWLSGPINYYYDSRENCPDYNKEFFDCIECLESRLLNKQFVHCNFQIDPTNLMLQNDDWTKNPELRRAVPKELCQPTPGSVLPEDDLVYVLTQEDIARREAIDAEWDQKQPAIVESTLTPKESAKREAVDAQEDLELLRCMAKEDPAYKANVLAYERWLAKRNGGSEQKP